MNNITKILVRQGLNSVRKSSPGIILDSGEPGYTNDTKRLYIGDGVTVGGIPAGSKNWGTVTNLFSATNVYNGAVVSLISAFEAGDLVYDGSNHILYYALSATPGAADWAPYALTSAVSGYNGVAASTNSSVLSVGLGSGFAVNDSTQTIKLNYDTTINTGKSFIITAGNITVGGGGIITTSTGDSVKWSSGYSTVNTNSASWSQISGASGQRWDSCYSTVNNNSANWSGPQFIQPQLIAYGTSLTGWTSFDPSPYVSGVIKNVIIQCRIGALNPADNSPSHTIVVITKPSTSITYNYEIASTLAAGGQDSIMSTTQGITPVNYPTNNTFQWAVTGINQTSPGTVPANGCWLWLIGYYK